MQWHQADFRLRELGVNVVIVTFEGRDAASAYARETRLSYPILLDESRTLYRAYGLRTARGQASDRSDDPQGVRPRGPSGRLA